MAPPKTILTPEEVGECLRLHLDYEIPLCVLAADEGIPEGELRSMIRRWDPASSAVPRLQRHRSTRQALGPRSERLAAAVRDVLAGCSVDAASKANKIAACAVTEELHRLHPGHIRRRRAVGSTRQRVLDLLASTGPHTVAEAARHLGLDAQTARNALRQMSRDGVVAEVGRRRTGGGMACIVYGISSEEVTP